MSKASKTEIGRWGESIAEDYLLQKGFEIVARNWRTGRLEIDLIIRKEELLVFVEVKTRASNAFGFPEEFVSGEKVSRVRKASTEFQYQNPGFRFIRFDIVAISGTQAKYQIEHFEDAF